MVKKSRCVSENVKRPFESLHRGGRGERKVLWFMCGTLGEALLYRRQPTSGAVC